MSRIGLIIAISLIARSGFAQNLDSIFNVADTIPNDTDRIEWLLKVAYEYYSIAPDITESIGQAAITQAQEINYELGVAKANHILGIAYWTTGAYDRALNHNFEALKIYEKLDEQRRVMLIRMNNANIYGELGQQKKAIQILLTILEKSEKDNDSTMLGWGYNNISSEYRKIGKFDSALYYLNIGLPYREAGKDTLGIIGMNNNIGLSLIESGKPDEALRPLYKARGLLSLKSSPKRLAEVYANLSSAFENMNDQQKMKLYADSCLAVAIDINDLRLQNVSYNSLSNYHATAKNFEQSFHYFKLATAVKDTIFSQEVRKETEVLQLKYEDEKKAKQLLEFEKTKAKDQFDFWLLVIVATAILFISLLMIYTLRLRVRNSRLSEMELKAQLEQKNKELTSYALNFIQKNELLNELTDKITELKKQSDTKSIKELNQMNGIINSSFRMDQDWDNFKLMFEELHGDFFVRLKDQFPELGNAELKLCALLRLNMNLKESSRILGISADSVKTARYRLRKKLGLSTEDNLIDFLMKFDGDTHHLSIA